MSLFVDLEGDADLATGDIAGTKVNGSAHHRTRCTAVTVERHTSDSVVATTDIE